MDSHELTSKLKAEAFRLGFSRSGVAPAVAPSGAARLDDWLAAGYAGQMHYLADRRAAYQHPRYVLEGVRSILMLATEYRSAEPVVARAGEGRVSRYAWGAVDYHDLIHERLRNLSDSLTEWVPAAHVRGIVDTAPLLEREFAQLAGLGWIGKHTLLLNRERGSWFFLAALLTDVELNYDRPYQTDHCGTCRACLDACPTDAFPRPYVLDATRCISYLTIELRESIPIELRGKMGEWLFGCDVCQEVCPWNSHTESNRLSGVHPEANFEPCPENNPVDLVSLFDMNDDAFRERFRHTPLWRAKRRGILRNAAILLGNRPTPDALTALVRGLNDSEPLVRAASAWALGNYDDAASANALERRHVVESEAEVRSEIDDAIARRR
jgi:epoxyqueuosine reductase